MHAQTVLSDGLDPLDVIAPCAVPHAERAASGAAVSSMLSAGAPWDRAAS
ncbi:hypothetical protein ACSNOH_20515 [Streptomyces sp. URMC 127]